MTMTCIYHGQNISVFKTCWLQDLRLLGLVASIDPDRDGVKDILENVGLFGDSRGVQGDGVEPWGNLWIPFGKIGEH